MSSLVSFDSFEYDDYEEGYHTEPDKTPRHLYIEDDIVAREQSDNSWWVINGAWEGHIEEGEFVCDYNNKSCGKGIIITGEEWDNAGSQPNDQYGFLRAKKAVGNGSIREILQRETNNWLGEVRI
jgi:hypothetical protein